jgi:hypothetical protein
MTAIYTFDVFSSLDGFGSYNGGGWGGYWGKQGIRIDAAAGEPGMSAAAAKRRDPGNGPAGLRRHR